MKQNLTKYAGNTNSYNNKQEFLQKLKALAPGAVTADGKLNVSALKAILGESEANDDLNEKFGLNWAGKHKIYGQIRHATTDTLKPNRQNSVDFDKTQNMFIEGDNLSTLKILERSYFNKVKMIYIDPPYNTGNDFVYNDDFKTAQAEHEQQAGTHNDQGKVKRADGLTKNSKDKGRYHSNWLNMMYPRLHIARNLLKDDGVIFVSIDDNEVHHLRLIMDEIFGEENFIAQFDWRKKTGSNDVQSIAVVTEAILLYSKNYDYALEEQIFTKDETSRNEERYKLKDDYVDIRGKYYLDTLDRGGLGYIKSLDFGIEAPNGKKIFPNNRNSAYNDGWRWKWSSTKVQWGLDNEYFVFIPDENKIAGYTIKLKTYQKVDNNLDERTTIGRAYSNLILDCINKQGVDDIKKLFNDVVHFNNPKPVKLIQYLLGTLENSDDIVLDFFAGSGTTAHAVMEQNAKDGGNRKFILVQLPETTDETSEAYKAGYKTIADIARERIRRAGQKVLKDNADKLKDRATPLDIGFKDFAVSPSNFIEIPNGANSQAELLLEENLKSNVSDQDLLTQLRLLQGQTINNQPKTLTFGDLTVFVQGSICYCLQANANIDDLKALLKAGFTKIVILDRCFKNNQDSTNFEQQYLALDRKINLETY